METSRPSSIANASAMIGNCTHLGSVPLVRDQLASRPAYEWRRDEISHHRTIRMLSCGYQTIETE